MEWTTDDADDERPSFVLPPRPPSPHASASAPRRSSAADDDDRAVNIRSAADAGALLDHLGVAAVDRAHVDRPIDASNIGHALLLRMGWRGPGTGLGRADHEGRAEPVRVDASLFERAGLGKSTEYHTMLDETARERRQLESEAIAAETDEQRARCEQSPT